MKTFFTADHALHHSGGEFSLGRMAPSFEIPERAEIVRRRVEEVGLGPLVEPPSAELSAVTRVHEADYVEFLQTVFAAWRAEGRDGDVWPFSWRHPGMPDLTKPPSGLDARLAYYSFDMGGSITETTWRAVKRAADTALAGAADVLAGERTAFSLCRPPGHHAGSGFYGGYCYLNNAAIAAQHFRDAGRERVAILDIDYHHGNGTQQIFYRRSDVLVASIHGDPDFEYPFLIGYAGERGEGAGEGYNHNYPLPAGTGFAAWSAALENACRAVEVFAPDALVVSLGVDTFKADPISAFRLESADYLPIGRRIAALGLPTLFVMEGGYAVSEIGINVVNVLTGFEEAG